jgi:hypothetical protein
MLNEAIAEFILAVQHNPCPCIVDRADPLRFLSWCRCEVLHLVQVNFRHQLNTVKVYLDQWCLESRDDQCELLVWTKDDLVYFTQFVISFPHLISILFWWAATLLLRSLDSSGLLLLQHLSGVVSNRLRRPFRSFFLVQLHFLLLLHKIVKFYLTLNVKTQRKLQVISKLPSAAYIMLQDQIQLVLHRITPIKSFNIKSCRSVEGMTRCDWKKQLQSVTKTWF